MEVILYALAAAFRVLITVLEAVVIVYIVFIALVSLSALMFLWRLCVGKAEQRSR